MAKIRYYTDEHVAYAVIHGLRQHGVDVVSVPESGMLGATDEAHLMRSSQEGRVIFTQDTDFLRLAAAGMVHAGVIYAPQHTAIGRIVTGLMLIYQVLDAREMVGKIEYL